MSGNKSTDKHVIGELQARIAAKVREDSQNLAKLTITDSLSPLMADLKPDEEIELDLAEMVKAEQYRDIKLLETSDDTMYLYSETYIPEEDVEALIRNEEIRAQIAAKVREDSQNLVQLTSVDSLGSLLSDQDSENTEATETIENIEEHLAEMAEDERYNDIQTLTISTGAVYLYSEAHITKNYAIILGRAEANDPATTIAETVREESKIYPRPTRVELFKEQVFNINPDDLETFIAQTLERPEFKDIKLLQASTGARYLYSTLHMSEDYAKSLVEWEEVGDYENS